MLQRRETTLGTKRQTLRCHMFIQILRWHPCFSTGKQRWERRDRRFVATCLHIFEVAPLLLHRETTLGTARQTLRVREEMVDI